MKYCFFLYIGLLLWFFFWFRPRVNDGRIEHIMEEIHVWYNYRKYRLKRYINKKGNKK